MWDQKDADAYNERYSDYDFDFERFQNLDGYVATPLDGLWLKAPYLHNGSVPSLVDLLKPPDDRTDVFYRGYDVYDPARVGFVSDVTEDPQTGQKLFEYDTSLPGNSNQGHTGDLQGVNLEDDEKWEIIEYIKTLE